MKRKIWFSVFLYALLFSSCIQWKDKIISNATESEWMGQHINFPDDVKCSFMGLDTTCIDPNSTPYKVMVYIDSTGCTSCRFKLYLWEGLMRKAKTELPGKLNFQFYLQPKSEEYIYNALKNNYFRYPVYIDTEDKLNKLNNLPKYEKEFLCFLLDENNKILAVGNPTEHPEIWEKYKEIIFNKKPHASTSRNSVPTTTVLADKTEIVLDNPKVKETVSVRFGLKNTGNSPLIISNVIASCGCTVPQWDEKPVLPGGETFILVNVTPDSPGYFLKSIDVHCNIPKGSFRLFIKGTIKE